MKEKILEAFNELGFKLEEAEEVGYTFNYENINMMWLPGGDDEDFLSIAVPGILEHEDGKTLQFCTLLERINSTLKYVKAYILCNSIWLFYERELLGNDDLPKLISRMILHLEAAHIFSNKAIKEIEEELSSDDDDTEAVEITDDENDNNDDK